MAGLMENCMKVHYKTTMVQDSETIICLLFLLTCLGFLEVWRPTAHLLVLARNYSFIIPIKTK